MRLVISHCLPRYCDFARQGIARLRLRSTLTGESDLRLFSAVGLCRAPTLGLVFGSALHAEESCAFNAPLTMLLIRHCDFIAYFDRQ